VVVRSEIAVFDRLDTASRRTRWGSDGDILRNFSNEPCVVFY
jgi:hypothetical protein